MNSSALKSRDHGIEITTLAASIPIGDRALAKVLQITVIVLQAQAPSMLSWDQDRDLGLQVSRSRPRPGQNELECTRVSRPWSWNHNNARTCLGDRGFDGVFLGADFNNLTYNFVCLIPVGRRSACNVGY